MLSREPTTCATTGVTLDARPRKAGRFCFVAKLTPVWFSSCERERRCVLKSDSMAKVTYCHPDCRRFFYASDSDIIQCKKRREGVQMKNTKRLTAITIVSFLALELAGIANAIPFKLAKEL
jgi:hypothetical protein